MASKWMLLCLCVAFGFVSARNCDSNKLTCVRTLQEPYHEKICSDKASCVPINVPCGSEDNPFQCAFDEICVAYRQPCSNETTKEASLEGCGSIYKCEWRPYWEVDLNLFSARCTEYYKLLKNETCVEASAKFFLPWKVFTGFNPDIDCYKVGEGDEVCVHAFVEPKRSKCGEKLCKLGERCLYEDCVWKPKIGDRCGEEKCPLGYACHALIDESCEEDSSASHGTFYFGLTSDKEDT